MVDINVIYEECFLDEILAQLPNRVAKPTPGVKGKNLKKIFNQFSDSLKDLQLIYTCIDVSSVAVALGTNVGNAFIYQRNQRKILKISSEFVFKGIFNTDVVEAKKSKAKVKIYTKYVPTTCIRLAAGCTTVAFGHESGTFSVGLVDPPIHKTFESLTAHDVHNSSITCLEWSSDGLILYAGDAEGKISMSVVKISEGILQTAIIVNEDCSVVQLSYAQDALLISTTKRTVLWSFQTEMAVQIGEKERKTSGGFGGCFIPDILSEPTKKVYAARPGLRIWTADENGKVSSTSVFKSLLADKPPIIQTLIGNDNKFNSNGQFGQLLIFHNEYVITWDTNHVWVLDLDLGNIVGCHSNLGKVRDVAVCGHEVFILVNQRERFLRRLILTTERVVDESCLDAVVAGSKEPKPPDLTRKPGFGIASALLKVSHMGLGSDKSSKVPESPAASAPEITTSLPGPSKEEDATQIDGASKSDLFEKINAIPLDETQGDIVFTAAKKKKKKKKQKQTSVEGEKTSNEGQATIEVFQESPLVPTQPTQAVTTANAEEITTMETCSNVEKADGTKFYSDLRKSEQDTESETLAVILGATAPESGVHDETSTEIQKKTEGNLGTDPVADAESTNNSNLTKNISRDTDNILKQEATATLSEIADIEDKLKTGSSTTQQTPTLGETIEQEYPTPQRQDNETAAETQTAQETSATNVPLPASDTFGEEREIENATHPSSTTRQDSSDSVDVYGTSSELESQEEQRLTPDVSKDVETPKPVPKEQHVPLLADTWSGRSLPTTQIIEHLSISQKYIFCVDSRSRVYFSDPNTASCSGWEKADFKAKQIYANPNCDFICCVEGGKAFVRGNISDQNPVGNVSLQILDDVSLLTTCFTCTWAVTAPGVTLKRASTNVLAKMTSAAKCGSSWKIEDSKENLVQIVCYDHVLWARSLDETLLVYSGRSGSKKATWKKEDKKAKWLHMSDDGTVWIITPDDQIWFKPHVTASCAAGEEWYQVTLGQYIIDDPSIIQSTFNFFSSVGSAYRSARTAEYLRNTAKGLLQSTRDMAWSCVAKDGSPKQIYCNTQSGLWLLDTKNALHACRGQATGAYWDMVCPSGTAKSATWRDVTTGLAGYIWAIQPNGDLTCFHPKGPSYNVEGPSSQGVDFVCGSPNGLWCFVSEHNSKVYIRDGISEEYPQGFAWTTLSLRNQDMGNIKHLSIGRITVWAVDDSGQVWIRIGSLAGDESSVLSQAWLPLENPKNTEFVSVEVNCVDSMVWAIDIKGCVYARAGVREDFLVGQEWREVQGVALKSVCLSSYLVYGLCTSGEIVCRFGVSEMNCIGDYWKNVPGCFPQIVVNSVGELWAIDDQDKLCARKMKCLAFSRGEQEGQGGGDHGVDSGGPDDDGGDDDDAEWEML